MSCFEFRSYGFYRGNRSIGNFTSGYIEAESADAALKRLDTIICYDDCDWGIYLRKTDHVIDETKQNPIYTRYPGCQITGDFANSYGEAPAWVFQAPKMWEQEGFISDRLILRGNNVSRPRI